MLRILSPESFLRMPWKNGGGETLQLAVHPPGATVDTFEWRISSARVASSGPFSRFPGIDRSLAVLSGGGLDLHAGEHGFAARLDADGEVASFPGEWAMAGALADPSRPVVDFNVMSRRERLSHAVSHHRLAAPLRFAAGLRFAWVLSGHLQATDGSSAQMVPSGHALLTAENDPLELSPVGREAAAPDCELWLVELRLVRPVSTLLTAG